MHKYSTVYDIQYLCVGFGVLFYILPVTSDGIYDVSHSNSATVSEESYWLNSTNSVEHSNIIIVSSIGFISYGAEIIWLEGKCTHK